jgi:hypothetical protein
MQLSDISQRGDGAVTFVPRDDVERQRRRARLESVIQHVQEGDRIHKMCDTAAAKSYNAHAFEMQLLILLCVFQLPLVICNFIVSLLSMHEMIVIVTCFHLLIFLAVLLQTCFPRGVNVLRRVRALMLFSFFLATVVLIMRVIHRHWISGHSARAWVYKLLLPMDVALCIVSLVQFIGVIQIGRSWAYIHAFVGYGKRHGVMLTKRE